MMKKQHVIWLLVTLLISPMSALADENGKSGNVSWPFKSATGKLTLFRKGDMKDYKDYKQVPWLKFKNNIIQVEIKEGITSVGNYAFYGCNNLTIVDIFNTVTRIGLDAFSLSEKISSITLPESVTDIVFNAFGMCYVLQTINNAGGAARIAHERFGAVWGQGVGMQGKSYAIPTMQGSVETIRPYVYKFIDYAWNHPDYTFLVTPIGCGIAGFTAKEIAPLFSEALEVENILLPEDFVKIINEL